MNGMEILVLLKDVLLPIIAIIISVIGLSQAGKALKKQLYLERKIAAPCIILTKDEIILENNWKFVKDKIFDSKSINIELNILKNDTATELFPTLIFNFSDKKFSLKRMYDGDNKRFLNHALLSIKNIGNPLISIEIKKVEIIFDNKEDSFILTPKISTYYRFLDNNESFDVLVSFLFEDDCDFIDCSAIPTEDVEKIINCAEHNVLNVHLERIVNKYSQIIFHFELTNQFYEKFKQKIILDSSDNTYKTWIEQSVEQSSIQQFKDRLINKNI